MSRPPLYLIDASIYIFRAYFATPDAWFTDNGQPVNAVLGYLQFLHKFLDQTRPRKIAAAMDESLGSCFRNQIYTDYKCSRVLPDPDLAFQLDLCKQLSQLMGIQTLADNTLEADDLLAGLAAMARQRRHPVCVVSRDKDLGQILRRDDDCWWDYAADRRLTPQRYQQELGIAPAQLVDFLALVGDPVDDVPGVPGIGKKTAQALLARFGSLSSLLRKPRQIEGSGLRGEQRLIARLVEYREQIEMVRELVRLRTDLPMAVDWRSLSWQPPEYQSVADFIQQYGLGRGLLRQMDRYDWWR